MSVIFTFPHIFSLEKVMCLVNKLEMNLSYCENIGFEVFRVEGVVGKMSLKIRSCHERSKIGLYLSNQTNGFEVYWMKRKKIAFDINHSSVQFLPLLKVSKYFGF